MSEPNYVFKKGEGWVLQTIKTLVALDKRGKRVRIEIRPAKPGEYFFNPGKCNDYELKQHVGAFSYNTFPQKGNTWINEGLDHIDVAVVILDE